MVVLHRRFEAIIRDMINALFKSGRSGVLNTAMDFSCSLTDDKFQTVSLTLGLPVHVGAIDLIPRAVAEKFGDDIRPGDCFVNNSSYLGNTHCADFTVCTPVFVGGEVAFYTIARAHLGDIGFPTPTTYSARARDLYEEGLTLPCVRIQRDYKDVPEVIDICRANIRVPDQFYGDYLAVLAAVRTGEARLQALCEKYGIGRLKSFLDSFQNYAERMAVEAIGKLPKGRTTKEMLYDSELDAYPDGIPIRATIEVDPDAGNVTIDLRDNIDNLPLGINMTESTTLASCMTAVLTVLGPDVPRCSGSFRRVKVLMREGSAIGKPRFPAATSAATTNLCQALVPHLQSMFAEMRDGLGTAYGTSGMPGSCAVVSGTHIGAPDRPFVNQLILGHWGGPALSGHDGWLTYGSGGSQGMLLQSSVEMVEQQQPILIEKLEVRQDSGGAGQYEGGPGSECIIRPRAGQVRFIANTAARAFPPEGVRGGQPAAPMYVYRLDAAGAQHLLPISVDVTIGPEERYLSQSCGGGGYGDPLDRDPEKVRAGVLSERISRGRAEQVYGVILSDSGEVDPAATETLRQKRRAERVATA
ncbi:hydantoinase B/oxoprolinase family protein [Salipiger sp. P9]|uniref:hydantoinase B/oxoprolinase family protein n=1 Tax=Salipiger pentaromativorans TaxID=2943193 RepID=UPI0021584088|nr:hydantoinase B/oxoprolinase family protein [Salipiger pentaromativorans]MCR8547818.1 hydantoinase B/oxoprolinase family protein [Salipiger pentaromativorans]